MFGKYGDEIRGCRRNACAAAGIEGGVLKELQARAEAASPDFPPLADTLPGYTNVSVVHRPAGNPVDGDGEGVFAHSDGGDLKGSITAAVDLVADDVRLPFSTVPGSDAVGKRAGIERVSKYGVTVKVRCSSHHPEWSFVDDAAAPSATGDGTGARPVCVIALACDHRASSEFVFKKADGCSSHLSGRRAGGGFLQLAPPAPRGRDRR